MRAPAPARQGLPGFVTLIVLAFAAIVVLIGASGIPVRFPFNLNEGWNALHAQDAMAGRSLYATDGYANFPNYLPAWFYILGWAGALAGDYVLAGRIIGLLAQVVVAINVGRAAFVLGASRDHSLLAGGLFILFGAIAAPNYLGMADPQWLAHAIQSLALVLLLRPLTRRTLIAAFALLLLGGLIKHNLAALPVAATLWLALTDRRSLLLWLGMAAVSLPVLAGIGYLAFGTDLFTQVFGHRRLIDIEQLWVGIDAIVLLAPFVAIAALTAWKTRHLLAGLYLAAALIFGAAFGTGVGVHANTWFDLGIAALPLVALAATRDGFGKLGWMKDAGFKQVLTAALCVSVIIALAPRALGYFGLRVDSSRAAAELAPIIARIAAADGPVACEDPTLCYWANRRNEVDFINLGARLALDPAEQTAFEAWLDTKPLALIQLYDTETGRLPAAANAAITRNYEPALRTPITLLLPRK